MEIFNQFGYGVVSFLIGVFALSNVFLPLFYTLPKLKKERKNGTLIKNVPMIKIIWAPFSWTIITLFGLYYSHVNYAEHITQIYVGLGIAAFGLIKRIGGQNTDMDEDFRRAYKDYL